MCRLRLEDLHGSVNVTIFPRTYEGCRELVEDGEVLLVRGKTEDSGEEPALLADEVYPLAEALDHFRGGLQVMLSPEDQGALRRLMETLGTHRGKSPLFFSVSGNDGVKRRVAAGPQFRVQISEGLARELAELLGHERVGLVRV